jgi:hypothetical protein
MHRNHITAQEAHRQAERVNLALNEQFLLIMCIAIVLFAIFSLLGGQVTALYTHIDAGFTRIN